MSATTFINLFGGFVIGYYVTKHYFVAGSAV